MGENLSLDGTTVTGNSGGVTLIGNATIRYGNITANDGVGIGVSIGRNNTVTIDRTTISGNSLSGIDALVLNSTLTVSDSIITGNGDHGIQVELRRGGATANTLSTVSGNSTSRNTTSRLPFEHVSGGGIYAFVTDGSTLSISYSTISDNTVPFGGGGGVYARTTGDGSASIDHSTISGNSARVGGGVHGVGTISHSTITGNRATFVFLPIYLAAAEDTVDRAGGGIGGGATLDHTIVAGNTSIIAGRDDILGDVTASYSLIGDDSGATIIDNGGNIIGTAAAPIDPLLGPLADNGGPTMTHALLPGSPAIDAGDPAFVAPPHTDQRGYYRVIDGDGDMTARIDIGAFEYASVAPLPGDGNLDGTVDDLDYLIWTDVFGDDPAQDPPGAPMNGDFNGDGVVDGLDYFVWAGNFGATVPTAAVQQQAAHDAALDTPPDDAATVESLLDQSLFKRNNNAADGPITAVADIVLERFAGKKHSSRWRR